MATLGASLHLYICTTAEFAVDPPVTSMQVKGPEGINREFTTQGPLVAAEEGCVLTNMLAAVTVITVTMYRVHFRSLIALLLNLRRGGHSGGRRTTSALP